MQIQYSIDKYIYISRYIIIVFYKFLALYNIQIFFLDKNRIATWKRDTNSMRIQYIIIIYKPRLRNKNESAMKFDRKVLLSRR